MYLYFEETLLAVSMSAVVTTTLTSFAILQFISVKSSMLTSCIPAISRFNSFAYCSLKFISIYSEHSLDHLVVFKSDRSSLHRWMVTLFYFPIPPDGLMKTELNTAMTSHPSAVPAGLLYVSLEVN